LPTFEVRFRDGRPAEIVQADEMRRERSLIVFRSVQLVILTPCWVVRRRLRASEVADVRKLAAKSEAMVSPDGYRVERILVQRSLRRPPRPYLRVSWRGYWIADCRTVAEVARYVDLATLTEERADVWRRGARAGRRPTDVSVFPPAAWPEGGAERNRSRNGVRAGHRFVRWVSA
jgi:hypothetical protein